MKRNITSEDAIHNPLSESNLYTTRMPSDGILVVYSGGAELGPAAAAVWTLPPAQLLPFSSPALMPLPFHRAVKARYDEDAMSNFITPVTPEGPAVVSCRRSFMRG